MAQDTVQPRRYKIIMSGIVIPISIDCETAAQLLELINERKGKISADLVVNPNAVLGVTADTDLRT